MSATNWTNAQVLNQLNSGAKWTGDTITYAFPTSTSGMTGSTEVTGFSGLTVAQQEKATLALSLWDDLILPDMVKVTTSNSNIEFGNSTKGVSYAQAYYPTAGTVWFNKAYSDLQTPVIGQHGFLTFIHEIGHSIGLNHMGTYNGTGDWTPSSYQDSTVLSVMSYFGPNWGSGASTGEGLVQWADWVGADGVLYSPQTPMLNDIMAVQATYGVETTTRVGDTIYGFHSTLGSVSGGIYDFTQNTHAILCLFDSSGNDTLDLSGWSTSSSISLVPGTFCSGNSMTNNISIAYTCVIENAVGGAGADVIVGNAFNNRLEGGGGNDTFTGGMGDDTIIGGDGSDTVVYTGAFDTFNIAYNADTNAFTISSAAEGTDTVTGVEYFTFNGVAKAAADLMGGSTGTGGTTSSAVSIAASTQSIAEGNSGSTIASFTLTLDTASNASQTVHYTVAGTGNPAADSLDFTGLLQGDVTFGVGETSKTIQVQIVGDTVVEQNESFAVTLSNASSGLTIATGSATTTIVNDDSAIVYKIINGNNKANSIIGGNGNDSISGFGGSDILSGGRGTDILNGGVDNDRLTGGDGADRFAFTDLHFGKDTITDFLDGTDKLTFTSNVASSLAEFTFVGNGTTTVTVYHGTDSIVVKGFSNITLDANDFLFV